MKKLIETVIYLFYRYYNRGSTRVIAYESAILAVAFIFFMNTLAIVTNFKVNNYWITSFVQENGNIFKLIFGALLVLPTYFVLKFNFKRESITTIKIPIKNIKRWNIYLIMYILLSIIFLIYSALNKN